MTRTLDRQCQVTLMPGTGARLAARANLATLTHKTPQHVRLLVVNFLDFVHTKLANLRPRHELAAAPFTAATARTTGTAAPTGIRPPLLFLFSHVVLQRW